jgi:hypothetical protein
MGCSVDVQAAGAKQIGAEREGNTESRRSAQWASSKPNVDDCLRLVTDRLQMIAAKSFWKVWEKGKATRCN